MGDSPFSELDRTALQEIDNQENQRGKSPGIPANILQSARASPGHDRWGVNTLWHAVFVSSNGIQLSSTTSNASLGQHRASSPHDRHSSKRYVTSASMLEMGHARRQRRSKTSNELASKRAGSSRRSNRGSVSDQDVSTDSDEARDVEKQRRGLVPLRKTQTEIELDSTAIPYQVPSDDTSGYQETPEELRMDQEDRIKTEQ